MSELSKDHNPKAAHRFVTMTAKVDSVRKEQFYDIVPELKILQKAYTPDV